MTVRRTQHVRPRLMNRAMDHKRRRIQQPDLPAPNHLAIMIDMYQIAPLHERESDAERVHPEGVRIDGIADGDVAGDAFVEAVFAEDAQGGGEAALEVFALFVFVGEFGGAGEFGHLHFGLGFGEAGVEGEFGGGEFLVRVGGGWRGHGCCVGGVDGWR